MATGLNQLQSKIGSIRNSGDMYAKAERAWNLVSPEDIAQAYLSDLQSGQVGDKTLYDYMNAGSNRTQQIGAQDIENGINQIAPKIAQLIQKEIDTTNSQYAEKYGDYFTTDNFTNPFDLSIPGTAGEGASSNRSRPIEDLNRQIVAGVNAKKRLDEATQEYEKTGVVNLPDWKEEAQKVLNSYSGASGKLLREKVAGTYKGRGDTYDALAGYIKSVMDGTKFVPSAEVQAKANAAAARAGTDLPFPSSGIDKKELSRGATGVVTPDMSPEQFYDDQGKFKKDVYRDYSNAQKGVSGASQYQPGKVEGTLTNEFLKTKDDGGFTNQYLNSLTSKSAESSGFAQTSDAASKKLVADILKGGNLTNLQQNPTWTSQPQEVREQAFQTLNSLFNSPQSLGQFVNEAGITNLQQYDWWNQYPDKQQAWNTVQQLQQSGQQAGSLYQTGTSGSPSGSVSMDGTQQTGATQPTNQIDEALSIIQNSNLPDGVKALFGEVVQGWDPSKELNTTNIIEEFNKIKSSTIDPYFQQQADLFIDDVKRTQAYANETRDQELQSEQMQGQQAFENTQQNLEARGMTFSGEANEMLGNASAYNPTQKQYYQFGQAGEGKVQAQNRLMSSSNQARYMKNLADLQRQTEQTLGTPAAKQMFPNIKGIETQAGSVTGSLAQQKNQQEASTLSNLYGQAQTNYEQNKNINIFK